MNKRWAVIMAGGSGERFWPLSRRLRPKQLLPLAADSRTLLEEAVTRATPLIPEDQVLIATSRILQEPVRACGCVPGENVLAEPSKRNTAGCLAYVAAEFLARFGDVARDFTLAVLTADHQIGESDRFLATLDTALSLAEQEPAIVVIGVPPSRPETGYGYIEMAENAAPLDTGTAEGQAFPVACFREKPDAATAQSYLETGRFLWNSGMFFWKLSTFLDELALASPAHAVAIPRMAQALRLDDAVGLEAAFNALADISIDYALMEKARRVAVVPATFAWDDIGSWDALDRSHPKDADGNVTSGNPVLVDTRDCIVYNEAGAERIAVAALGVQDLAIIVSEDAILVIPKDRAQEVRKIVDQLKQRDAKQL